MEKKPGLLFERFAELLRVRSILTLTAWGTFLNLALAGLVSTDVIVGVINILLGFWFGEQVAKRKAEAKK